VKWISATPNALAVQKIVLISHCINKERVLLEASFIETPLAHELQLTLRIKPQDVLLVHSQYGELHNIILNCIRSHL
jgi:hypothetical protein